MWPFKRRPLLDRDTADWHLENFEWLVRCYADSKSLASSKLVLPKPGFFPNDGEKGHALALRLFDQVKDYAQIGNWPVDLVQGDEIIEGGRSLASPIRSSTASLGMFIADGSNRVEIAYSASLLSDPQSLIATLAHELGHYIISLAPIPPVCAEDEIEFLTDLAAIYMGFGVFLANSAFKFEQWRDDAIGTQGWQSRRHGYLPEPDLIFGTAIFLRVKGLDPTEAEGSLKPHLAKQLRQALRDLDEREPEISGIRALEVI